MQILQRPAGAIPSYRQVLHALRLGQSARLHAFGSLRPFRWRTISVRQPCMAETPYLNCSLSPSSDSCTRNTKTLVSLTLQLD